MENSGKRGGKFPGLDPTNPAGYLSRIILSSAGGPQGAHSEVSLFSDQQSAFGFQHGGSSAFFLSAGLGLRLWPGL